MNLFKSALFCAASSAIFGISSLYGAIADGKTSFQLDIEESDESLINFINSKRKIPLTDKVKNLKISGDVHTEWAYQTEKIDGKILDVFVFNEAQSVGDDGLVFLPGDRELNARHNGRTRFDFFVDWDSKKMWARTNVRYENSIGVIDNAEEEQVDPQGYRGSGSDGSMKLREAYVGYEIFKRDVDRFTVELGRRGAIYKLFYSEIQFNSRFDGFALKYSSNYGGLGEWYGTWAGFVIDQRANHFGWAGEVGIENIMDTGLDAKYSYIDWHKSGRNRFFITNPIGFRFKVSQWSLLHNSKPKWLGCRSLQLFGAFLMNHIPARKTFVDANPAVTTAKYIPVLKKISRQNLGGFVGFQYRIIEKEGDWQLRAMAAFCEAQCVPDNDVRNIGTGNSLDESFTAYGRGNTNWKGFSVKGGYALTDHFVIEGQVDRSWAIDNEIAGSHSFTRWCVETTYSF